MSESKHPYHISRRESIQWILSAGALSLTGLPAPAQSTSETTESIQGYGSDPNLLLSYSPGDLWSLTLSEVQTQTIDKYCDLIIPEDEQSPSAVNLGVTAFIDEWVSAPYPTQIKDRELILKGITWTETESKRRYNRSFSNLNPTQSIQLCESICDPESVEPKLHFAALFFHRLRSLIAIGYYTTPQGMKDLGYVGNTPLATFEGPPPEILEKLKR